MTRQTPLDCTVIISYLSFIYPLVSVIPLVLGYDHVIAQQEDIPDLERPPGHPQQQVLASVGPEQRHLREKYRKMINSTCFIPGPGL